MDRAMEVRVVVTLNTRDIELRPGNRPGEVWFKPGGGLDSDGEVLVADDLLVEGMAFVRRHNVWPEDDPE